MRRKEISPENFNYISFQGTEILLNQGCLIWSFFFWIQHVLSLNLKSTLAEKNWQKQIKIAVNFPLTKVALLNSATQIKSSDEARN